MRLWVRSEVGLDTRSPRAAHSPSPFREERSERAPEDDASFAFQGAFGIARCSRLERTPLDVEGFLRISIHISEGIRIHGPLTACSPSRSPISALALGRTRVHKPSSVEEV